MLDYDFSALSPSQSKRLWVLAQQDNPKRSKYYFLEMLLRISVGQHDLQVEIACDSTAGVSQGDPSSSLDSALAGTRLASTTISFAN